MNKKLVILCVEDEPEVLEAIVRDLAPFEEVFSIEPASSATEAREIIDQLDGEAAALALVVCDHVMPGQTGVEFLTALNTEEKGAGEGSRKVLLTGQAGHEDTIEAINQGGIHHYLTKPWEPSELVKVVRSQLTAYVVAHGLDPLPFFSVLDQEKLAEVMRRHGPLSDV